MLRFMRWKEGGIPLGDSCARLWSIEIEFCGINFVCRLVCSQKCTILASKIKLFVAMRFLGWLRVTLYQMTSQHAVSYL